MHMWRSQLTQRKHCEINQSAKVLEPLGFLHRCPIPLPVQYALRAATNGGMPWIRTVWESWLQDFFNILPDAHLILPYCWWFRNPVNSPVEVGSLSHYLQGFIHPKWLAGCLPSTICQGFDLMFLQLWPTPPRLNHWKLLTGFPPTSLEGETAAKDSSGLQPLPGESWISCMFSPSSSEYVVTIYYIPLPQFPCLVISDSPCAGLKK